VVVVGLGLVGGSLARDLRRAGYRVAGVDRPAVLRRARAAGVLDTAFSTMRPALEGADLLVFATPPRATLRLLRETARFAPPALVMTDCASVKRDVMAEAHRLGLRQFVGGHPIAGTEGRGFAASREGLFRGRSWVLTPQGAAPRAVRRVRHVVRRVGARPVTMTAADHDRALAFLSHLPQVVAWALFDAARKDKAAGQRLALAGPGFRDMTRLNKSPRPLWREILEANGDQLRRALRAFQKALVTSRP
jgi:prephenate dehydrogenase